MRPWPRARNSPGRLSSTASGIPGLTMRTSTPGMTLPWIRRSDIGESVSASCRLRNGRGPAFKICETGMDLLAGTKADSLRFAELLPVADHLCSDLVMIGSIAAQRWSDDGPLRRNRFHRRTVNKEPG